MAKYPFYQQDDESSCGVYCLKMIMKYYGINEEIYALKKKCRITSSGVTIKGLLECLKDYSMEAKAFHCPIEDLSKVELPCILHTVSNDFTHYIVLYEIKKDQYIVGDPSQGIETYSQETLSSLYTLNMISISHIGRFNEFKSISFYNHLKELSKNYKKEIIFFIRIGIITSLLSIIISYSYQLMIDSFNTEISYPLMIVCISSFGMVSFLKLFFHFLEEKKVIELERYFKHTYLYRSFIAYYDKQESQITNDVGSTSSQLNNFNELSSYSVSLFKGLFVDFIMMFFLIVNLMIMNIYFAFITILIFVVIGLLMKKKMIVIKKNYQEYLSAYYGFNDSIIEFLTHHFSLRRLMNKKVFKQRYESSYELQADKLMRYKHQELSLSIFIEIMHQVLIVVIFLIGFILIKNKLLTIGQLFNGFMLINLLIEPYLECCMLYSGYQQGSVLFEVFKQFNMKRVKQGIVLNEKIQKIEIDDLSYSYGYSHPLFEHFDLTINHSLFIKGSNGCGKSTLLKLLMNYDDQYKGHIYINNKELRDIDEDSLYKRMLYISNQPVFFRGTLLDNLMSDEKRIISLLDELHLEFFKEHLNDMMHYDGQPLSLGQQQMIQLLRGLLLDCDVYLLDEAMDHIEESYKVLFYDYFDHLDKLFIHVSHDTKLVNSRDEYVIMNEKKSKG